MRAWRMAVAVLYVSYLVQVGLMMIVIPWSEAWPTLVLRVPPAIGRALDRPDVRGGITAFGLLHLGLAAAELLGADARFRRR